MSSEAHYCKICNNSFIDRFDVVTGQYAVFCSDDCSTKFSEKMNREFEQIKNNLENMDREQFKGQIIEMLMVTINSGVNPSDEDTLKILQTLAYIKENFGENTPEQPAVSLSKPEIQQLEELLLKGAITTKSGLK